MLKICCELHNGYPAGNRKFEAVCLNHRLSGKTSFKQCRPLNEVWEMKHAVHIQNPVFQIKDYAQVA